MFSTIHKKLLFIILIIFTSTQRFAKQIPISCLVGSDVFQPSFKPCPHGSVHFKKNVVHFCNKTRNGYEFLMKELALRFNAKVHVSLCQYQLYKFVPLIQNWLTLDGESSNIYFCKPSSASAIFKLPCKPGIPSPEVLKINPTAMFFTKNEIIPGRLVKTVSERTIRCCYSSHSSADEIIDFLSSLQFGSITPFVCPDKDAPLDSVKAFILNTLKHQIQTRQTI